MSGSATFEIIAKPISGVTISDNDQSKTYDGQAAGLDLDALSISGTDTVSGTALSDTGIQASDFDWYYASGNKLDEVPNGEMNNKLNAGLHAKIAQLVKVVQLVQLLTNKLLVLRAQSSTIQLMARMRMPRRMSCHKLVQRMKVHLHGLVHCSQA